MMTRSDAPGPIQGNLFKVMGYKGEVEIQVVNRFRKRKPRSILRWWKRRSAIEPVIGHVKSDHGMERSMLAGSLGDRINAVLAGVGFSLVKFMKGLARLFLCLRTETGTFADFLSALLRFVVDDMNRLRQPLCLGGDFQKQGFV